MISTAAVPDAGFVIERAILGHAPNPIGQTCAECACLADLCTAAAPEHVLPLEGYAMSANSLRRENGFSLIDVMAAVLVVGVVSAIALPVTGSSLAAHRFRADGQALSNLVGLAKMRAASQFSRGRVFANLATGAYGVQIWNKTTAAWTTEGGVRQTSRGVTFGFGALAAPPPNTQAAIGFAAACRDDDGAVMANTACIVFNSRGIPIDNAGAPTGGNALYLTDGTGVYAVTVTATPLVRFWWSRAQAAAWVEQQ